MFMILYIYKEYNIFFFKQRAAYEMRISDWSSDVCSSDLDDLARQIVGGGADLAGTRMGAFRAIGDSAQYGAHLRRHGVEVVAQFAVTFKIGRASCRESVCQYV